MRLMGGFALENEVGCGRGLVPMLLLVLLPVLDGPAADRPFAAEPAPALALYERPLLFPPKLLVGPLGACPGTAYVVSALARFICASNAIASFCFLLSATVEAAEMAFLSSLSESLSSLLFLAFLAPVAPPSLSPFDPDPDFLPEPEAPGPALSASTAPPPLVVPRAFLVPPVEADERGTCEYSSSANGSYSSVRAVSGALWALEEDPAEEEAGGARGCGPVSLALAAMRSFRRCAATCSSSFLRFCSSALYKRSQGSVYDQDIAETE